MEIMETEYGIIITPIGDGKLIVEPLDNGKLLIFRA